MTHVVRRPDGRRSDGQRPHAAPEADLAGMAIGLLMAMVFLLRCCTR